jgi:hypothetical protein
MRLPGIDYWQRDRKDEVGKATGLDTWIMLFFGAFFQFVTVAVFWFVDIIPYFGFSSSVKIFGQNLIGSLSCSFGGEGCHLTWLWGLLFNLGFVIASVASAGLNEDSANFTMLASLTVTPLTVIVFVIFPIPGTTTPPWWSYVFSLILFLVATILWKLWEHRQQPKETKTLN